MNRSRSPLFAILFFISSLGAFADVHAQSEASRWPERPIRLVVPYPPGGATDLLGRLFAVKLSSQLSQSVVVDNRGGATGGIGARTVAQSAPDGYTLLFTVGTDLALSRVLSGDSPVDPDRDLTAVIAAVQSVTCIAASASAPVSSLEELVRYAKANPNRLSFGSPGIGSAPHLSGEMLRLNGIELLHVPFKGSGPTLDALLAGRIDVAIADVSSVLAAAKSGKVKILAMTHDRRYEGLPDVPSVSEALPGAAMPSGWYGLFGPAKMPRRIVAQLNNEMNAVLAAADVRPKIEEASFSVIGGSPQTLGDLARRSVATYAWLVKAANIQPE